MTNKHLERLEGTEVSAPFIASNHYSSTSHAGVARYGWYSGTTLLGVSVYDTGTYPMQKFVFGSIKASTVLHHHRLAIAPGAPKNTASQFIAACHKALKEDYPGVLAVVTYADLCMGHTGAIYKATNALFTGIVTIGNIKYVTPDLRVMYPTSLKGSWPERREQAYLRGWKEYRCQGKLRFVYLLGSSSEKKRSLRSLQAEVLPYPNLKDVPTGQLSFLNNKDLH